MKTRNSSIYGHFEESELSNKLEIITKFPEKWILIDTENFRMYQGTKNKVVTTKWKEIFDNHILDKIREKISDKIKK